jgi:hypothetical protein
MTEVQQVLSAEEQALLGEIMRWASMHQLEPTQTANALVRVTRAIHLAILHLDQISSSVEERCNASSL